MDIPKNEWIIEVYKKKACEPCRMVKCFIIRFKLLEFGKNREEFNGVSSRKKAVNLTTVRFFLEFSSVCWRLGNSNI